MKDAIIPDGSVVKNLPAMQKMWFQFLGWDNPLEKEMAAHYSILAWEIPWREEPGRIHGVTRVCHDLLIKPPTTTRGF